MNIEYVGGVIYLDKKTMRCDLQKPEIGSIIQGGEAFEVIATCPHPNKDASHAFIYIAIEYQTTKNGERITEISQGGACLINEGDEFG